MEPTTSPAPVTGGEKSAIWEDFIDIFYAPSAVFARRKMGSFFIPLLVVTLFVGVTFFLTSESIRPIFDAEFDRAMAARAARTNQQIPPEAVAQMRDVTQNIGRIAVFVFLPIGILLSGGALWLAGKVLGAKLFFKTALMVGAYSQVPRIPEAVVNAVQGVILDPASLDGQFRLTFGPGRFLDPDTTSALLLAFVGPLDPFSLWVAALVAIGLSVTGGITLSRAAIGAAFVWFVSVLPRVPGAISQM
jgi:Yip1 domain